MKKFSVLFLAVWLFSINVNAVDYTKIGNSVTINVTQAKDNAAKQICLQVISSNIIRVQATPTSFAAKKKSLIIVPQTNIPSFYVQEINGMVQIQTSSLIVSVSTNDGRITFFDKKTGKTLLNEAIERKTFAPITIDGTTGVSWREMFESSDDEAFYGLGQHQAGEYNYKGKNEELFQYNTKVSIPFIISNHNYGILWDSYSLCRFGQPNDYMQLNRIFNLYDKYDHEVGLTGSYITADNNKIERTEDSLYFENIKATKFLPKDFPLNKSKVIYEGAIEAKVDAIYRFILYYAGYIKVYLDNQLVVPERWRTAWNPNSYKFTYHLKQGVRTPIRIEWQPDGNESYFGLRASYPSSETEQNKLSIWSEMTPDMDYYVIFGKNMDDVISGYRTLTGKCPIMPKWALGYWQSRERYNSQDEILSTLKEFRKRNLPIDNIVQDWFYWKENQWGSHQFDPSRYPNPQMMLDSIHSMHGRFMISCWPKFYVNTDNYKAFDSRGWMYHQAVKDSIRDWVGKGYVGSFYDAYSEGARKLFWKQMDENLYSKYNHGIDAWWMDASEPNIRDCTDITYRKQLCGPTALGSSTEYFNAYALENAEAIYNGQRSVEPNKRVFLLTRSGFAGLQRYSTATWSGDIGTRWEDMRAQMTAGLNFSMSGIPFWGMDIGGFSVESRYISAQKEFEKTGIENEDLKEWRELNARWNQFGAFVPLYRTHGQYPYREPWNLAPENHPCYKSILYYSKLRYNMMPYLYSITGWTHLKDYTLMRGLIMDFEKDSNVNNIGDQWMFGPALMVCPIGYYKARSRDVYFPNTCDWFNFYTGTYITGGKTMSVDAPYERIPLFVKTGSIIPFGPDMQYSDEKKPVLITLYVYEGANGNFMLYEDDGTNYDYEKGQYNTINFSYNEATKTLTIGNRQGTYNGMITNRNFNIVSVSRTKIQPFDLNAKGKLIKYIGKKIVVKL
jgi:alpha-D-xyloside xylohydrolase